MQPAHGQSRRHRQIDVAAATRHGCRGGGRCIDYGAVVLQAGREGSAASAEAVTTGGASTNTLAPTASVPNLLTRPLRSPARCGAYPLGTG